MPQFPGRQVQGEGCNDLSGHGRSSHSMLVELQADNSDGALFANAYCQVHFQLPGDPNMVRVPATALLPANKGVEVAVLGPDDKVTLKSVQLGRDFGDSVEILTGLSRGDKVIDSPPETLLSGQEVRLSPAASTLLADQAASRAN